MRIYQKTHEGLNRYVVKANYDGQNNVNTITIGVNIICGGSIEKQNERVAFEQMTLDIGVAKLRWEYVSLVWTKFCFSKGKTVSYWLLLKSSRIVLINPRFVLLICDQWFVFLFPLRFCIRLFHQSLRFHSIFFNTIEVNGYSKLFILNILQNYLLFCSTEKKKFTQLWNNLRFGKR